MKLLVAAFLPWLFCVTSPAPHQPEPILLSAQLPMCRGGCGTGEVRASFVISRNGAVESVDILSGPASLTVTTESNIRSWKFEMPHDLYRSEWRYETTFDYHLSGREVEPPQAAKLTVTVDSFHHVEITSDAYKPVTIVD
jgi:hypothetical protein